MGKKRILMMFGSALIISVLFGVLIWEIIQPVKTQKVQKMPEQNKLIREVSPEMPSGNEKSASQDDQNTADLYYGDQLFQQSAAAVLKAETVLRGKGHTYYAAPSGADSNDGTREKPFNTLDKAVSSLQKGDILYLTAGIYTEQLQLPDTLMGDPDHYITIAAAPGEKVILDAQGQKEDAVIKVAGSSYLQIQGLEIRNSGKSDACGILVKEGSNHLIISGNEIHRFALTQNSQQSDLYGVGILLKADGEKRIHNVLIYNNFVQNCNSGERGCISAQGNLENINVLTNQIYHIGGTGIQISGSNSETDKSWKFPVHCLISQNQIADCTSAAEGICAVSVSGGQHMKIASNSIAGCAGGIFLRANDNLAQEQETADITVTENNIRNNLGYAVLVGGDNEKQGWVKDVRITANNCQNDGSEDAVLSLLKCDGAVFSDNTFSNIHGKGLIVDSKMSSDFTRNIVFQKNIYGSGQADGNTEFLYLGIPYHDYETWIKAAGETEEILK